ncbi:MAG: cyclic nucleotide-binding domain-containing protein [Nitrospinae bacterium]|nr:cyclic nucleotide-binding domain-containing protein [Nitrospinota bacterium]
MSTKAEDFKKIIKDHAETIKNIILFQGIPVNELGKFIIHCDYKELKKDEALFNEGDHSFFMAILLSGGVDIFKADKKIFSLPSPALIGEIGLFTGMPRNATVRASDNNTIILTIVQSKFDSMFVTDPKLSHKIHRNIILCLGNKINEDNQKIITLIDNLRQKELEINRTRKSLEEKSEAEIVPNKLLEDMALQDKTRDLHPKRKHLRVSVTDPSLCFTKIDGKTVNVKDISQGGVRLNVYNLPEKIKENLHEGNAISGELCLKGGKVFPFTGTVKIIFPSSFGVEFKQFTVDQENTIEETIETLRKLTQIV